MPQTLMLPIMLRLLASGVFIGAAIYAGVSNRSMMIVVVLAAAAVIAQLLARQIAPSPVTGLKAMFKPDATEPTLVRRAGLGFAAAFFGYGLVYGLSALIAALFQETEFAQSLTQGDFILALGAGGIALVTSVLSARLGASQIVEKMEEMQHAFAQMKAAQANQDMASDDDFTIDGEFHAANDTDSKPGEER